MRLPERNWAKRVKVPGVVKKARGMDDLYVRDPSGSLMKFGQMTETLIPADTAQAAPSIRADLNICATVTQ